MRALRSLFLLVGALVAAFVLGTVAASAQQPAVVFTPDPNLQALEGGEQFSFTASVPSAPGGVMGFYRLTIDTTMYEVDFGMGGVPNAATINVTMNRNFLSACIAGNGYIRIQQQVVGWIPAVSSLQTTHVPCSVAASPEIASPGNIYVCGPNNDTFSFPAQPSSVNPTPVDSGWINGQRTFIYKPAPGYWFRDGVVDTFVFTDTVPCKTEHPVPPTHTQVCGFNNDVVTIPQQPTGVEFVDYSWIDGTRSIVFLAADGYVLPDDARTAYDFTDSGPCMVTPNSPEQTAVCGNDNDTFTFPGQQTGINPVPADSGWNSGERSFTYSPLPGYAFANEFDGVFEFTDIGPCITDAPLPPTVTEVCGPNNDVVLLADSQPANVLVTSDDGWTDEQWTIIFSATENHALPTDVDAVLTLTDVANPCPTDAPVSPVQTGICGPDNDLLTIPEQPEGVTLDTDSGWVDGKRTVEFLVAPEFITDGPTSFAFRDANVPCEVEPTGTTLTVILRTSDGASIAGSPYALYAPVALQAADAAPYREGTMPGNQELVFEDLPAGTYRFVTSPAGYEPVDELIVVDNDQETQQVTITLTALQATTTPVPSPTAPTPPTPEEPSAPAPAATTASGVEPTATSAVVTSLPATGTGSSGSPAVIALSLVVFGLGVVAIAVRRLMASR